MGIKASVASAPTTKYPEIKYQEIPGKFIIIQENSIFASASPINPLRFENLINCLIHHESKGNSEAKGKYGEIGILQFKPQTFKEFCIDKYKLAKDISEIWNKNIQIFCADKMLLEGKGYFWTTYWKCF